MALGATWFSGAGSPNYTDIRCDFDDSGASTTTSTVGSWKRWTRGPGKWLIFLGNKRGGISGSEANKMDQEYGYVYGLKDSDASVQSLHYVYHFLRSAPAISADSGNAIKFPFGDDSASYDDLHVITPTGGSATTSVFIYQPFAWYGRVGQVIAAIMLVVGLDDDYIDQASFSDADDGQAAMGSADEDEPYVFYRRQMGQKVSECIKQLATHSWDILCLNMAGKIALSRRVSPGAAFVITSLDTDDGLISAQWRYAYELLVNHAWASHGRYYDHAPEDVDTSFYSVDIGVSEIAFPSKVYETNTIPFQEFTDATSVTKYGERWGPAREAKLHEGRETITIKSIHYPYLTNIEGAGGTNTVCLTELMSRLADVEAVLRREVTVVQDFRGLDYDVGYAVEDVAVTKDGATIADTRCIKKTVDFKDFTVTSVLLEEPS